MEGPCGRRTGQNRAAADAGGAQAAARRSEAPSSPRPQPPPRLRSAPRLPLGVGSGRCQGRPHSPGTPRVGGHRPGTRSHLPRSLVGRSCCPSGLPPSPTGQRKVSLAPRGAALPSPARPRGERTARSPGASGSDSRGPRLPGRPGPAASGDGPRGEARRPGSRRGERPAAGCGRRPQGGRTAGGPAGGGAAGARGRETVERVASLVRAQGSAPRWPAPTPRLSQEATWAYRWGN